ncbi:MAG: ATP-dependent Clp protease ATP-binding subunit [Planctomycetes bacterium]|nr:ATP-dependent Clp protease ATP-binding subunit [Planctomycetota bacterium]MCP4772296.1 ATP-dependent Clp protease ATP-binding subunit [Planctomycetota bacterium]MCP4861604.1 ATP-dependent Clp protease ATP-binding subunit [Planctomycetota bacterium]
MSNSAGIVYKYFDLIDGFIRVRILSQEESLPALQKGVGEPPSRREYRRMVVESCVVGVADDVFPKVHAIYPEDTVAAEDLLYQIVIDVNPNLEIHSVALPAESEEGVQAEDNEEFFQRAASLEKNVLQELVGQDEAVAKICRAVRKSASGIADPLRPIGSFMLVGRTGTGKTELAKSLARHLFASNNLIRIDCSEFALPHETAKLIGAPPGYVGHNDGGTLTEALMRDPKAVILFDEIEKGHEKLHNMLLQILDEGRLTDSKGKTVVFNQALVLMTSNVGTADYRTASNRVGFGRDAGLDQHDFHAITDAALRANFKPEMLNRLDGTLTFRALDNDDCTRIAQMQLQKLNARMHNAGIDLRWSKSLAAAVAEAGYCEEYGAREVRRALARMVEEPLSSAILDGEFSPGTTVYAGWRGGKLSLRAAA